MKKLYRWNWNRLWNSMAKVHGAMVANDCLKRAKSFVKKEKQNERDFGRGLIGFKKTKKQKGIKGQDGDPTDQEVIEDKPPIVVADPEIFEEEEKKKKRKKGGIR